MCRGTGTSPRGAVHLRPAPAPSECLLQPDPTGPRGPGSRHRKALRSYPLGVWPVDHQVLLTARPRNVHHRRRMGRRLAPAGDASYCPPSGQGREHSRLPFEPSRADVTPAVDFFSPSSPEGCGLTLEGWELHHHQATVPPLPAQLGIHSLGRRQQQYQRSGFWSGSKRRPAREISRPAIWRTTRLRCWKPKKNTGSTIVSPHRAHLVASLPAGIDVDAASDEIELLMEFAEPSGLLEGACRRGDRDHPRRAAHSGRAGRQVPRASRRSPIVHRPGAGALRQQRSREFQGLHLRGKQTHRYQPADRTREPAL